MNIKLAILAIALAMVPQLRAQVLVDELTDSPIQAGANFGFAIDTDGDWLAVSSSFWDDHSHVPSPQIDIGSVNIYKQIAGNWVFYKQVLPEAPYRVIRSQFGKGLSIADGVLVIGQANASTDSTNRSGRIHIYQIDAGGHENWGLVQIIDPPQAQSNARFGFAVDNIDDIIIVGEHRYNNDGRVHVYQLDAKDSFWNHDNTLNPIPDCHIDPSRFGWSVAIDQSPNNEYALIVGDPGSSSITACPNGYLSFEVGSVHFFQTTDGQWEALNIINNISAVPGDRFLDYARLGHSVDLDITTGYAIAGAPGQRIPFAIDGGFAGIARGQALIFELDQDQQLWTIAHQYTPYARSDPEDQFGAGVAIDTDFAFVTASTGEQLWSYGRHAGGGYNQWEIVENIDLTPSTSADGIAHLVIDSDRVLISSPNNDSTGVNTRSGSVFQLDANRFACPADINRDGTLDSNDPMIYIDAYFQNDQAADWDSNGSLNYFDISAFITDYAAGCN